MPNTDPIASVAEYRKVFPATSSEMAEEELLLEQLKLGTRYLERITNRVYWQDAAATDRIYLVEATDSVLPCDEMAAAPVSVSIDAGNDGTYEEVVTGALPARDGDLNAGSGPAPRAYNELILTAGSSRGTWSAGERVKVNALHGAPAVHDDAKQVVIQLVGIWRMQSPRATGTLDEFGRAVEMSGLGRDIVTNAVRALRRRAVR